MSTNISEEEFIRLQNQLIELRTTNYQLEEQHACQFSRNQQLQSQLEALERECAKAHSSLSSLKKVKNGDLILQNERLQHKLQVQEDDFRLQNQTLLQELSKLTKENERLGGTVFPGSIEEESISELKDKVKRLTLEAGALHKALSEERLRSASEITKLKDLLAFFTSDINEEISCENIHVEQTNTTAKITGDGDKRYSGPGGDAPTHGKDSLKECLRNQDDMSRENNNDVKLVSTCSISNFEVEDEMQDKEKLKLEKERRESLEKRFAELQLKHDNYMTKTEKKVDKLEENLQIIASKQEKQLCEMERYENTIRKLKTQVEHLKCSLNECEVEKSRINVKLSNSIQACEDANNQLTNLKEENQGKDKSLAEMEKKMQGMADEVERVKREKDLQVGALEQQLVDREAELGLRERKGAVVCRDLKRQLVVERRKVERLQERMRDVLEGTHLRLGNEALKVTDADNASVSSWSLMSGSIEQQDSSTRESSLVAGSPTNINGNLLPQPDDTDLEQESRNLLERIASLQEEKWALEEKVNYLEHGMATLTEQLTNKTAVIEFYCMEGRNDPVPSSSGKKPLKKLSDYLKFPEDEHLHERSVKMQRMLEELLTKNMYLQESMAQLSTEIEKLRLVGKLPE